MHLLDIFYYINIQIYKFNIYLGFSVCLGDSGEQIHQLSNVKNLDMLDIPQINIKNIKYIGLYMLIHYLPFTFRD